MDRPSEGPASTATARARGFPGGSGWPVGLVFGLLAVVAGGLPSFSLGANLLVFLAGGVIFTRGLIRPSVRCAPVRPPSVGCAPVGRASVRRAPVGAAWWLLPLAGLVVVETATYAVDSPAYPTLSLLADPWLEQYPVRSGAFLLWISAFWALARR